MFIIVMTEKDVFQLFKSAFITNCELDGSSVTEEEQSTLEELDSEEVLENLKDLLNDLLAFKQKFKQSNEEEIVERSLQFEAMIQKLEGEVRNHIGVEHQLKLHVENTQAKVEELEHLNEVNQKKLKALETPSNSKKEEYEKKIESLVKSGEKKDKIVQKLESENAKMKKIMEEKSSEIEALKRNSVKPEILRKRLDDRNDETNKIRIDNKQPFKVTRDMLRAAKKRAETDVYRNSPAPYIPKDNKSISRGHKSTSKQHVRSISDNRSYFAKRAPSR